MRKDGTGPTGNGPKKVNQGIPKRDGSGTGRGGGQGRRDGTGAGRGTKRGAGTGRGRR